jgi:hypothetical protein
MQVHDEHIDDFLYSEGWTQVSTQVYCKREGCHCEVTGECKGLMFNQYLVEDPNVSPISQDSDAETGVQDNEASPSSFPVCVTNDNVESIGVEEIRCKPHTVGSCYMYYKTNVLQTDEPVTMISVAVDGYKSACFNMACHLLEMHQSNIPRGALAIASQSPEVCWVLARSVRLTTAFLSSLCEIDISPMVGVVEEISVRMVNAPLRSPEARFVTSGFAWSRAGPNMLWSAGTSSAVARCRSNAAGVRAVKTALVTMSLLLTPKSLYGGKNPTTKLVTYFVHNICHGRSL